MTNGNVIMPNQKAEKLYNDVQFYMQRLDIALELLDDRQLKEYIKLTSE